MVARREGRLTPTGAGLGLAPVLGAFSLPITATSAALGRPSAALALRARASGDTSANAAV